MHSIPTLFHTFRKKSLLGHAYALEAAEPEQRERLLKDCVRAVFCDDGGCTTCTHCVAFEQKAHPDIFWADGLPSEHVSIDTIHSLQRFIAQRPQIGSHTVAVLPHAHRMTVSAANALLKSIEEPPAHSCLLLGAQSDRALISTIRSRVQVFRVPPQPAPQISEEWSRFLHGSVAQRMDVVKELFPQKMDHVDFKNTLHCGIVELQSALRRQLREASNAHQVAAQLEHLDTLDRQLSANVNKKMILDSLITTL